MTWPSAGTKSPVSMTMTSPLRRLLAGTFRKRVRSLGEAEVGTLFSFLAATSRRAFLSESAWALPLPSAIASAKLANNRVNHSQKVVQPTNQTGWLPPTRACGSTSITAKITVVTTEPTKTRNITGLRNW